MPLQNRVIDNRAATVADHLRRTLRDADSFSLASAYFTIYGYELLAEELDSVGNVRFLFGDPTSVEDLDPGASDPRSFEFTERGLEPNHTLQQKALAKRCADWVDKDSVAVRSISRANFLHGKMYLTESPDGGTGIVGSSNFTKRGLGGSDRPNLEINLATGDTDTLAELQDWFDRLWSDERLTEDVKRRVLDALERIGGDYAPEAVYYKTLYELFRKDIEARLAADAAVAATGFTDSQIWNALYEFQKDGAKSVIAKLREHNGCILADSVGLGKTYTALAVIIQSNEFDRLSDHSGRQFMLLPILAVDMFQQRLAFVFRQLNTTEMSDEFRSPVDGGSARHHPPIGVHQNAMPHFRAHGPIYAVQPVAELGFGNSFAPFAHEHEATHQ